MIQLTEYQTNAIEKLHNGCVLRGGTGSGKTLTSLVYVYEKLLGGETPIYPGHKYKKQYLSCLKDNANLIKQITLLKSNNNGL